MTLDEYFDSLKPFEYGVNDCCLFPANWILDQTGKDPGFGVRYGKISEEFANGVIKKHGGLLKLLDGCFLSAGMKHTRNPKDGDVGLVKYDGIASGSIMKDGYWWVISTNGKFPIMNAKLIRAWTF